MMDKVKKNYIVEFLMALAFLVVVVTALIMFFAFDLGIRKQQLSLVHKSFGFVLAGLVILHIILHINWIVAMTKNIFRKKE
jgi:cytochrome b561